MEAASIDGLARGCQVQMTRSMLWLLIVHGAAFAQSDTSADASGDQSSDCNPPPTSQPAVDATSQPAEQKPPQYYFRPKTISGHRSEEPASYARPLSEWGYDPLEPVDWLLFGVEQRTRYEYFDDDYTKDLARSQPFLMRSRSFLGIQDILDPVRFGVEFQDSRAFNTKFPEATQDVNENDLLQAYGEMYFKDAAGQGQPLSLQVGRLANDYMDRRLRTRNGYRNTTSAFDGFRLRAGDQESLWELEFFAAQPVAIQPRRFDHGDEQRWFYGLVGAWRGWAPVATIEPYYLILDNDRRGWNEKDIELHTFGMRTYGDIPKTRFDYDVDAAFQYGRNLGLSHRAMAAHTELGYTFNHKWKPRLAAWLNYATGDRSPNDGVQQRFNRLFGSSNGHYGSTDYFEWSNMLSPAMEIRVEPDSKTLLSCLYRTNWLASKRDAWIRSERIDPEGHSGRFIGHEINLYARRKITDLLTIEIGYAHFIPGNFVEQTGEAPDSDRLFISTIVHF
jgi:hypothetical protein